MVTYWCVTCTGKRHKPVYLTKFWAIIHKLRLHEVYKLYDLDVENAWC